MGEEIVKISLLELNRTLKEGIQRLFPSGFWVVAEISDMNTNQSGHCYLELIEKSEGSENIVARARATIWSFTFRILKPYFESVTGQRFSSGLKVLVLASVEFHEVYGFSLNIKDIDPNYTIGDMAKRKQDIIKRLTSEGVIDLNKELEVPLICKRIAVISSETAAGYGDFVKQLKHNAGGFKFKISLFQASMQGDDTERSIIAALESIYEHYEAFDVVVIIRGGGSQAELNYFNNYNIAFHITQFPIPVFTGIGHDRDQTITDLVAHTSLKTPTAVAEHILGLMNETAGYLEMLGTRVISLSSDAIVDSKNYLDNLSVSIRNLNKWQIGSLHSGFTLLENTFNQKVKNLLPQRKSALGHLQQRFDSRLKYNLTLHRLHLNRLQQTLPAVTNAALKREKSRIQVIDSLLLAYNPVNILKRGYSITYLRGKAIYSPLQVQPGDIIETRLADGFVNSKVE
ncbi:MAG TPA: exodeoxyribonuclease VII large subunit [Bacteroidales bacterium]|nr:exodeoxyribonuclease VII large subunit [Bacteroidales bacterium]